MPVNPREMQRRPQHERRRLLRRLEEQTAKLKEFGRDRTWAEEELADWNDEAQERLEMVCDIAFPLETPSDPTTAAVLLGRIQGFLEPLRKAHDILGLTNQMQLNIDKTRESINDLGEEADFDDDN